MTTLKGATAGVYYVEALPNYYLDSGEPRGRWHGHGADLLGLAGEVDDAAFLAVMGGWDPRHEAGEVPLGLPYNDRSVRGFDVTASAPKSVSVLFAVGDDMTRRLVMAAHDAAVTTMLGWVEDHCHTRFRINGEVAVVDAEGIVAATFRQHTSRALDPQLHTHVVIANKVVSPDGRWLALDARGLKLDQRTLSAIYHATLRSELTGRLGVEWRDVANGIAEMAHVPDEVLLEFSSRTAGVQRRLDEKLDRFIDTFDRDPTPRERWRLEREAVLDSRPAKSHNFDAADLHAGWTEQVRALGHEPERLVADAVGHVDGRDLDPTTMTAIMGQAVAALSQKQSTWRPAELTRELAAALPTDTSLDAPQLIAALDGLTEIAIGQHCVDLSRPSPDGTPRRRDGRPITESVADRALTTPEILAQEQRLLDWAERRMALEGHDAPEVASRSSVELTHAQQETAAAIAGTGDLVLVVGPAGTGKTTALAPAVRQLHTDGRTAFGVAPSAAAAEVLGAETGIDADTIDKLIIEHSLSRPPLPRYDLPAGTTVIVDEAGMIATDKLATFANLADTRGWRVALVGDPLQFSAVGRGGMFESLIDIHGAIRLDEVHRFRNEWEREASLRLRRGDPTIAEVYDAHERLHGGTATRMKHDALRAWWTARQDGEPVVLSTPTVETAVELNNAAQQLRIDAGQIDTTGPNIHTTDHTLYIGDEIATRQNNRRLHTDRGHIIRNRDTFTITDIHPNGDLTARGRTGTTRLTADYIDAHVELGYAGTAMASQGRTLNESIMVMDTPTDCRGTYVPMTRGRHSNTAYIVTADGQTAAEAFADAITRNWIDQPAHVRHQQLNLPVTPTPPPGPVVLSAVDLEAVFARYIEVDCQITAIDLQADAHTRRVDANASQLRQSLERIADSHATIDHHTRTLTELDRPLHRRANRYEIAHAKQGLSRATTRLEMNQQHLTELQADQAALTADTATLEQAMHHRDSLTDDYQQLATAILDDRRVRGRELTDNPPTIITNAIGEPPADPDNLDRWQHAAGAIDQHRTAHDITDKDYALGKAPERGSSDTYAHTSKQAMSAMRELQTEPTPTTDRRIGIDL